MEAIELYNNKQENVQEKLNHFDSDIQKAQQNIKEVIAKVRQSYSQDWEAYNLAQTKEKAVCQQLFLELLNCVEEKEYKKGRPSLPMKEKLFCMFLYIFNGHSSRRSVSDFEFARQRGIISEVPHFNTILNFFKDEELVLTLCEFIEISALPLRLVEQDFAVDSSGFSTSRFERWFNIRTQKDSFKRAWKKANLIVGVKSRIITSLSVTDGFDADSPELVALVEKTAKSFDMKEVCADKAYLSRENMHKIAILGAVPFIPFKSNSVGNAKGFPIWREMFRFYTQNQEKFLEHYHKRSNVETAFSMIKRKFNNNIRTKRHTSQVNEILMKCLCHNLCVLVKESYGIGLEIDLTKCAKDYNAQKETN